MRKQKRRLKKGLLAVPVLLLAVLAGSFLLYTGQYYHADADALSALESDHAVSVTQTAYGWFFDGPSEEDALVFYPGGKVEETAYAPLLHLLAAQGMDVCLVKMPFRLAVFAAGKANEVILQYDYAHWYIGGHSLGGAMAAYYAAGHPSQLTGVILLAAYPTKQLADSLRTVSVYGSADGVLNMEKLAEGDLYMPEEYTKCLIEGGNHAQFGNYGKQRGDGNATVPAGEQRSETVRLILQCVKR